MANIWMSNKKFVEKGFINFHLLSTAYPCAVRIFQSILVPMKTAGQLMYYVHYGVPRCSFKRIITNHLVPTLFYVF